MKHIPVFSHIILLQHIKGEIVLFALFFKSGYPFSGQIPGPLQGSMPGGELAEWVA